MKKFILLVSVFFALNTTTTLFVSCNEQTEDQKQTDSEDTQKTVYGCPMNCEHGKTYDEPGECPVCGMEMEPVKNGHRAEHHEMDAHHDENPEHHHDDAGHEDNE